MCKAACCCSFATGVVEPLRPTEDTPVASMNRVAVAARIRRGVSHVAWRACSQDRAPEAPAIAVIAQPAHMSRSVRPSCRPNAYNSRVRTTTSHRRKTGMAGRLSKSPWSLIRQLHEERFGPR